MALAVSVASLLAAVALSAGSGDEIVVTRESAALPSGCTPREVAELLVRVTEAVNAGDTKALDRLFAVEDPPGRAVERPETYFRWYSVTEGREGNQPWRHTVFYDRVDVLPYFAERHRLNERWQLIGVDVGPAGWIPGAVGISYVIRRDADDLPASLSRVASGKGSVDCAAQRIFVWSMGQDDATRNDELRPSCPLPTGWAPGNSIVACARSENEPAAPTGPNARAVLPDFKIVNSSARLPNPCAPKAVSARIRSALTSFNAGRGTPFAKHFTSNASFVPYGVGRTGPVAIARFVNQRYVAGDGWTAARLVAPSRHPDTRYAVYRLDLRVTTRAAPLRTGSAKLVVACNSGLVSRWIGPTVAS